MNIASVVRELLDREFEFRERPTPVPGDARLAWRIATCLLILYYSRGRRASLKKIHYLGHALRTVEGRESAAEDLAYEIPGHRLTLRVEPAIPRALDFARGAGLLGIEKKMYELTAKGVDTVQAILRDPTLFVDEKQFLLSVKERATEGRIKSILKQEVSFGS